MELEKAFTYMFNDEEWLTKIGIGALLSFVSFLIVPILLLMGWLLATARNVINGEAQPLAQWDDWGGFLKDGGSLAVVSLVYTSPFILIVCIAAVSTLGIAGVAEASEEAAALGAFATFGLLGCLSVLLAIALFLIAPAIAIQYLHTNEIGACFRFGEILGIVRENLVDIIIIGAVPFIVSFVIGILNAIPVLGLCIGFVLGLVVGPYLSAVTGHLYGQLYQKVYGSKSAKFDAMGI